MWNDLRHSVTNYIEGNLSISISTNITSDDGFSWWITIVYGPANRRNKNEFWEELYTLHDDCAPNWLIGGDFNVVTWNNETTWLEKL